MRNNLGLDDIIKNMYVEGTSVKHITKELNISKSKVYYTLRTIFKKKRLDVEAIRESLAKGDKLGTIAIQLKLSKTTLYRHINSEKLSVEKKSLIVLMYQHGDSVSAIARFLNMTATAVRETLEEGKILRIMKKAGLTNEEIIKYRTELIKEKQNG